DGVVVVGVAEQFLHSSHVLVHRIAQEVHSERLEHPAEKKPGQGMASGGLEHDLHRHLTLNPPPDRAPEVCAHGHHRNAASVAVPRTSRPPEKPTSITRGGLRSIGHSAYGFMT